MHALLGIMFIIYCTLGSKIHPPANQTRDVYDFASKMHRHRLTKSAWQPARLQLMGLKQGDESKPAGLNSMQVSACSRPRHWTCGRRQDVLHFCTHAHIFHRDWGTGWPDNLKVKDQLETMHEIVLELKLRMKIQCSAQPNSNFCTKLNIESWARLIAKITNCNREKTVELLTDS